MPSVVVSTPGNFADRVHQRLAVMRTGAAHQRAVDIKEDERRHGGLPNHYSRCRDESRHGTHECARHNVSHYLSRSSMVRSTVRPTISRLRCETLSIVSVLA